MGSSSIPDRRGRNGLVIAGFNRAPVEAHQTSTWTKEIKIEFLLIEASLGLGKER